MTKWLKFQMLNYIDGNHSYDYVKIDLTNSLKKVKIGGYITGDDYLWLNQTPNEKGQSVKKAVDEFLLEYKNEVKLISIKYEQYIIQRIK